MKKILVLVGAVVLGIALIVCGWLLLSKTKTAQPPTEQKQWSDFY